MRQILGFHIGFEEPGTSSVMLALRMAILNKRDLVVQHGLKNDWAACGIPGTISSDLALEFRGTHYQSFLHKYALAFQLPRGRTGRDKPFVERAFHRVNTDFFHHLPGTTFSNTKKRGAYNSEKEARLDLQQLRALYLEYVVDDYNETPHVGLNRRTPHDVYLAGIKEFDIDMPQHVGELDMLMTPLKKGALTRTGVSISGMVYGFHDNERLFQEMLNDPAKPHLCNIFYDQSDMEFVYVEDWRTFGRYLRLRAKSTEYHGVSELELDIAKESMRRKLAIGERPRELQLAESRVSINTKIKDITSAGKAKGRDFTRLVETRRQRAADTQDGPASCSPNSQVAPAPSAPLVTNVAFVPAPPGGEKESLEMRKKRLGVGI